MLWELLDKSLKPFTKIICNKNPLGVNCFVVYETYVSNNYEIDDIKKPIMLFFESLSTDRIVLNVISCNTIKTLSSV